jgi:hypothetical protein
MIDALIKRVSVTDKCYEMYAHRGEKGATARTCMVVTCLDACIIYFISCDYIVNSSLSYTIY